MKLSSLLKGVKTQDVFEEREIERVTDKDNENLKNALFVDQRWADWFPALFDKVCILKDYGYNSI